MSHTDGDHLHVTAMEISLELVHIFCDDTFVHRVELTSASVVLEGAIASTLNSFRVMRARWRKLLWFIRRRHGWSTEASMRYPRQGEVGMKLRERCRTLGGDGVFK